MAEFSRIGLARLAVMGQNLALNIVEKGFPISVYNRSPEKVDRAKLEGNLPVEGFHDAKEFVLSIQKPRALLHDCIMLLFSFYSYISTVLRCRRSFGKSRGNKYH